MDRLNELIKELGTLLIEGLELQIDKKKKLDLANLAMKYESWYTRALSAVTRITPERSADFISAYKLERRKEITYETYCISDYLLALIIKSRGEPIFDTDQAYQTKLLRQLSIIQAAIDTAPSVLRDIYTVLRAELFDNDIESAKELAKKKHLRSAGVICGVVLEGHLNSVADGKGIKLRKKSPTVSDINDALKNKDIYDIPMWRLIQRLGDIRNLCAHSRERDPSADEVDDLIRGTEKVIKEVF